MEQPKPTTGWKTHPGCTAKRFTRDRMFGFFLVLLSSIFFAVQNVTVKVLFAKNEILGYFWTGGFVEPTLRNSFLLLSMRTLLMIPLMSLSAPKVYPETWKAIGQLSDRAHRKTLLLVTTCGGLMFLYLALLYIAIGTISTGVAMAIFFTYPAFTALFAWKFFGDRLTLLRLAVMSLIFVGGVLTTPSFSQQSDRPLLMGVVTALTSGIAYAAYCVVAQKCFETLHPVPFTYLSFGITFVLAAVSLLFWHSDISDVDWLPLWIGSLVSASVTFVGHLLNNYGIRLIGAAPTAMLAASNPALTALLAWVAIRELLHGRQIIGVFIVTLGVALLSQKQAPQVER